MVYGIVWPTRITGAHPGEKTNEIHRPFDRILVEFAAVAWGKGDWHIEIWGISRSIEL